METTKHYHGSGTSRRLAIQQAKSVGHGGIHCGLERWLNGEERSPQKPSRGLQFGSQDPRKKSDMVGIPVTPALRWAETRGSLRLQVARLAQKCELQAPSGTLFKGIRQRVIENTQWP